MEMSNKETAQEILENFRTWAESDAVTGGDDFETLSEFIVSLFKKIFFFINSLCGFPGPDTYLRLNNSIPKFAGLVKFWKKLNSLRNSILKTQITDFLATQELMMNTMFLFPGGLRLLMPLLICATCLHIIKTNMKGVGTKGLWMWGWLLCPSFGHATFPNGPAVVQNRLPLFGQRKRSREGGDEYAASLTEYVKSGRIYTKSKDANDLPKAVFNCRRRSRGSSSKEKWMTGFAYCLALSNTNAHSPPALNDTAQHSI